MNKKSVTSFDPNHCSPDAAYVLRETQAALNILGNKYNNVVVQFNELIDSYNDLLAKLNTNNITPANYGTGTEAPPKKIV